MSLTNPDSIYTWVTRGQLPKTKRRFILAYINERLRA